MLGQEQPGAPVPILTGSPGDLVSGQLHWECQDLYVAMAGPAVTTKGLAVASRSY